MRASGILLPVFALPGNYGIGGFSKEAFEWIDRLEEAGQRYWQILPLGPTGFGDSPYQSFSTFAGNPYLIAIDRLKEEGLLTEEECARGSCEETPSRISYELLYEKRLNLLHRAFERFADGGGLKQAEFQNFVQENSEWLEDYALFVCLKKREEERPWTSWEIRQRKRDPEVLEKWREALKEEIRFVRFLQYEFFVQWSAVKAYANRKHIQIIGDVPIYVAMDSADAWANPELFQFDSDLVPRGVAGCPPDGFAPTGQLWGNPLYNWDVHKKSGYDWWIRRMKHSLALYDVVRIDHFRGFESYYSVPYLDPTAERGHWEKGPGLELFRVMESCLGEMHLIAEDLGFLTDEVRSMVKESTFPGMKVLQFAFDSGAECEYLPHMLEKNSIIYTGTHDNETTGGYLERISGHTRWFLHEYTNIRDRGIRTDDLIRMAMQSVCDTCIIPVQDYLDLGNEARINHPSTLGGNNWRWRMEQGAFSPELVQRIRHLTWLSGRL